MTTRKLSAIGSLLIVIAGVMAVSPSGAQRSENESVFQAVRAEFTGNELAIALLCAGTVGFVLALRPRV